MSASTAIGMVSESLQGLLSGEMEITPKVKVTLLAPDESGGDRRVNLFLFKLEEHPIFKNAEWQVRPGGTSPKLAPPPLSLNLFYLLTAYAPSDSQTGNATAHEILGDAMRVFYENSVLPHDYLVDGLTDATEQIKIVQMPIEIEAMSQVWSTFSHPFRLSVIYQVSVVQIDAAPDRQQLMPKRVRQIGRIDVQSPFRPPVVHDIQPISAAAGATVTLQGEHLAGWQAHVLITGKTVVDGVVLTQDDQFTVTLPADLAPGLHEVRVDIARLFRRVFLVEVTA